jgi:hypothetical protein
MRPQRTYNRPVRRGVASVLSLQLLGIFATMVVVFAAVADLEVQKATNFGTATVARFAAESGLSYATNALSEIPIQMGDPGATLADAMYQHLTTKLNGANCLTGRSVSLSGEGVVSVPEISPTSGEGGFSFSVREVDATTCRLTVTGTAGAVTRTLTMDYTVAEDTTILKQAVASRSPVILTDNAVVRGEITSTWTKTNVNGTDIPPFKFEPGTRVVGALNTVLSEEAFNMFNSGSYIEGQHEGLVYEESTVPEYTADDFDTSSYRTGAADITTVATPDYTLAADPFPSPSDVQRMIDRPVYENKVFGNVLIPRGLNPKFVNCKFTSITFVDSDDTQTLQEWSHDSTAQHALPGMEDLSDDPLNASSNNIVFENCLFEGPVVTAVPNDLWWSKNVLTFTGETHFKNVVMAETTIFAPNFAVDIGGLTYNTALLPDSKLTGMIIGGTVSIRAEANIEGTVLSMWEPGDDLGSDAQFQGTKIGCSGGSGTSFPGDIRLVPAPDNALPDGIRKTYTLSPVPSTYVESTTGN